MGNSFIQAMDWGLRGLLWAKFSQALGATNMTTQSAWYPKGIALRTVSEKQGADKLPFFNVWRTPPTFDWDRQRTHVAVEGLPTIAGTVKTVPAKLSYDAWFWTKDLEALNKIAEIYLFWWHRNPNLDITFNDTYRLGLDIHLGDLSDESPLDQVFEKGTYYVWRMPIVLDGWVFQTDTVKIIKKIYINGYDITINADGTLLSQETIIGSLVDDSAVATDSVVKQ